MLNAVAERALRLCNAAQAVIVMVEGESLRYAAGFGSTPTIDEAESLPLTRGLVSGRAILDRVTINLEDLANAPEEEFPLALETQRRIGHRALLCVPLMREERAIGAIAVWRMEPVAFTDKQVALVQTFADQAAIAIENVRLFNETREALEQQTAISEILRVISGSPGDVQPMLDAVVERALKLCDAAQSGIFLVDGDGLKFAARFGTMLTPDYGERFPLSRGLVVGRAIIERHAIHHPDMAALVEDLYPDAREPQKKFGFRALLAIPLMREDRAIGAIALWRTEARAFTDKQIALVDTFADQAAIAIENVRLFDETKEALEKQTATSEILRVISSSPTTTKPVFEAIAERATRLCDANQGFVHTFDGGMIGVGASFGVDQKGTDAIAAHFPMRLDRKAAVSEAIRSGTIVQIPDVRNVAGYEMVDAAVVANYRSTLSVPMRRDGQVVGAITVTRAVAGRFSDKQVDLLTTFASQAVIAIENVRLFNATKEALDQQRASAEVLAAISNSIADTQPVFDKILESCERLFAGRTVGINLVDEDGQIRLGAFHGPGREELEKGWPAPVNDETGSGRAILSRGVVHFPDVERDEGVSARMRQMCEAIGVRSVIFAPMLWEGGGIGAIFVGRDHPGTFSDKDIALLKTFADQAVIAIQNARLVNETQEGLEQQTAIAEILRVISASPTDVQPVLDAIAERAARYCDASAAQMYLTEGNVLRHLASKGPSPDPVTHVETLPINRETMTGRALLDGTTIQVHDLLAEGHEFPASHELAKRMGHRTVVATPLFREGHPFGAILLRRNYVKPFSDREIALLRTFGDQAAIALENVRLFNETKEALDQQRASGEVLAAISSSIADTTPVFETILASCERLFAGKMAVIDLVGDDGLVHLGAYHGPNLEQVRAVYPHTVDTTSATGTAIATRGVVHFANLDAVPDMARGAFDAFGIRAAIGAPMLWEGKGIGAIWVARESAGPFSEKDIALLKTFADQAVIAIQNARLVNETKEALDQQRASGEVLATISSSIADTTPVFERILESCERLFAGTVIAIEVVGDDGSIRIEKFRGPGRPNQEGYVVGPVEAGASISANAILARTVQHIPDIAHSAETPARSRQGYMDLGVGAAIVAPMLWEGRGIGCISVARDAAGPFTEKDIALLKTFADQAVIAIQNARLFREIQDKSRELEVANKHKSEFLANMSHELRTPLNAIIGFSEVLLEKLFGEVNEKQEDYLKDIYTSGKHLLGLINDILDLSKVEAGRMDLELSQFDLPGAVSNALTLVRERAQRHNVALHLDVDPALTSVTADERKLKQILVNLLTNAVKFTPDGGRIDVVARRLPDAFSIAVSDTGIGIAKEDHQAVFEEFRQVGRDYTRKQEGTGLGLTLTRKFVELHGGRIWVESELGKGSTFTFSIPTASAAVADEGTQEGVS